MNIIQSPHDSIFREFLHNLSIARDFLEIHLPAHLRPYCDLSTLQLAPESFVDEKLRQHYADVVYSLQIKGQTGYIYVLIEHISQALKLTPFTVHRYLIGVMKGHLDLDKNHKTLPIVIPLLFYRGTTSPYPTSLDILDCFEDPELAREVFLKPANLIDLSVISDEALKTHKSVALLEIIQKHIRVRDVLQFIRPVIELLKQYPLPEGKRKAVLYYLFQTGQCVDYTQLINLISESAPTYQEDVMTIAQQLEQKGLQAGLLQGIEKGKLEGKLETAREMLQVGSGFDFIKKVTGLSDLDLALLEPESE